ncbi:hypothetical protein MPSEU_000225000 [Mayamaea pseudoterrestris]|nr:hypothetical protein MPSEU_000225000 [Mayamaea pseudoterrestris]
MSDALTSNAASNDSISNDKIEYCITLADVQAAAVRIQNVAHCTPVLTSQSIDALSHGRSIYFKVEAMQKTGSFKFRGAYNAVSSLLEEHANESSSSSSNELHVVTHSSGNHAQALARAAQLASVTAKHVVTTIVMPNNTPSVKRQAVADFGATIVYTINDPVAREAKCDEILKQDPQAVFVHPSEDLRVIAGQGTISLEMLEQVRAINVRLDVLIIPVGGGGLAAGNVIALRGMLGSHVKIVLAEPETMNDAKRSFDSKTLCKHVDDALLDSVADGLKTTLGQNTFPIVRDLVNDVITVSEVDILRATKLIWERLKVAIEPSAGVGVAVLMYSHEFQTKYPACDYPNVGVILCGGNVDIVKMANKMQEMGI